MNTPNQNLANLSVDEKRALLGQLLREKTSAVKAFPVSFAQQRLWILEQLEPGNAAYNMAWARRALGELDVEALREALNEIVRRHESLRTSFVAVDGQPVQVVSEHVRFELPVVDLRQLQEAAREAEAARLAGEEAERPFDLSVGPLFRGSLLRLGEEDQILLLTMHHIVTDGWSMGVLHRELTTLYEAYSTGKSSPLEELAIQYADFAVWQREWLQGEELEKQLGYWREQLAGAPAILELSTDRPRPAIQTFTGAYHTSVVRKELTESLKELSRHEGVTLFMTLLAAFQTMLYRYSNQEDIVVGTPIANRNRAKIENLIGFFVNTLVMRTAVRGEETFRELLQRVKEVALGAYAHQDLPFEKVVEELQPERSLGHMPLFQVLFALQNVPKSAGKLAALDLTNFAFAKSTSKLDLSLYVGEPAEGLTLSFEYSTDLFDAATIERMAAHFQTLLEGIVVNPDQRIADLPLITAVELQRILVDWNDTEVEYPGDQLVQQIFERQVERSPDAVALVFDSQRLTYRELNRQANQLANYLNKVGVGPESRVGILLERSANMVVGMLAILKAGGAYVPLDPAYPEERLRFMIRDAGLNLVLSLDSLVEKLRQSDTRVLCLDSQQAEISGESEANPLSTIAAENLAYVIYTSGSTGEPKGVAVTHGTLVHLWASARQQMGFQQSDVWTTVHSIAFDFSVWEIWVSLLHGSRLVVVPREVTQSAAELYEVLQREQVTVLNQTPAALRQLLEARREALQKQPDWSVRLIVCGGDALDHELAGELGQLPIPVWNFYGPTEGTVWATANRIDWAAARRTLVTGSSLEARPPERQAQNGIYTTLNSIGRPLPNIQVYLLNRRLQPVPVGVAGELFIGGAGLARGYFKRPDLSAEKFVPDPFSTASGARLYRTGDLARYRRDGKIEFIGRIDHQVKLRGFRIELGEIEVALTRHPDVSEAAVVIREDRPGDKRLVAYVVADEGRAPSPSELRVFLQLSQPDYMIPSSFVALDALPLTANKKVDRGALSAYDFSPTEEVESFVEPRTPVEEIVANIWAQVLGIERVGINDNFFLLGGHSLLATQVISRIRGVFHVDVSLRVIFQHPTVAGLVSCFDESRKAGEFSPLIPVPRGSTVPASFAQQRLWILEQIEPGNAAYNVGWARRVFGELDVEALREALNEIVRRHESLRTSFVAVDGQPVQVVSERVRFELPVVDLRGVEEAGWEAEAERLAGEEAERPFDLSVGPLFRGSLLRLGEVDQILLLTMHHIVTDGWSIGVLHRELTTLYEAYSTGKSSPLEELAIQYADFAVWQREWLQGEEEKQLGYWREQLAGTQAVLELPMDHGRGAVRSYRGARESVVISREVTEGIRKLSQREGVTVFMTLLAAFQGLLSRYTGQEDIWVGTPIANRNRGKIEDLIGFFVNTLVMRTEVKGAETFRELLQRVKEVALGAYAHQDLPFEKLVEELSPDRSLNHTPLFQVMFDLQNALSRPLQLTGLAITPIKLDRKTAMFDLNLSLRESAEGLQGVCDYRSDLFDAATIARMMGHFQILLEGIIADPDGYLSELPLLTEAERHQLLVQWNATQADYPRDRCMGELFEAQVERSPDAVAVVSGDRQLTYVELNRRANQLAHYLRKRGVGPEILVGICMERSPEMLIALLGVLKAGGAYVPLDPAYPKERISFVLEDTRAPVLLTEQQLLKNLPACSAEAVCLDTDWEAIASESEDTPLSSAMADNPVYVIYTSGSTGKPKGVLISHRALVNHSITIARQYGLHADDRTLQFASLSFDVAAEELFPSWLSGATVVLQPNRVLSIAAFLAFLEKEKLTVVNLPTSYWHEWVLELSRSGAYLPALLRLVIVGSETTLHERFAMWQRHVGDRVGWKNAYGPTEATITTTLYEPALSSEGQEGYSVPIGRPIANKQVYILDSHLQPTPIGVAGELHIGGDGLALGYLNRPELTAEKFIPNPFSSVGGARLYQTGDRARYLPDGNIEFLGRMDHQVKLRGFRIELGEIEAVLAEHPAVRESVVIAREDIPGDQRLLAYVVPNQDNKDSGQSISELESAQVWQWQAVWDHTYQETDSLEDPTLNISGWNSLYTGSPIPADEMREWVDATVERVLALRPKRVLEIGCGTGLLLFRIAPHCAQYLGTDSSPAALRYIQQQLSASGHELPQVTLSQRITDDLGAIGTEAFDVVILNSVVQYFPSVDYLLAVLKGVIKVVKPGGSVFIGDVRSFPLLKALHASVQLYQAPASLSTGELQQRIDKQMAQEHELVIDPAFFMALKRRLPQIASVVTQLKRGHYGNELTKFRYDVVLYIGREQPRPANCEWLDWQEQGLTLEKLREFLASSKLEMAGISRVPNDRLLAEVKTLELLENENRPGTVAELREVLERIDRKTGIDPEDLWSLGEEFSYDVKVSWSSSSIGCYDAVFERPGGASLVAEMMVAKPFAETEVRSWNSYATKPLQATAAGDLSRQLQAFLRQRVPEYMVPSAFVVLESLPLTPNGKVDRRTLLTFGHTAPQANSTYQAPRTAIEDKLVEIWGQVLRVDRVGVHDNFFELGGHSLLATQVISRVREAFHVEIPLRTMFEDSTVAGLAVSIAQAQAKHAEQEDVSRLLAELKDLSDEEAQRLLAAEMRNIVA